MTADLRQGPPQDLRDFRAKLRKELISKREKMTPDARSAASAELQQHLAQLIAQLNPASIGFCWPYRGEFDTLPLAEQWLAQGRALALPVVLEPGKAMLFRAWSQNSAMGSDRYGIPVPLSGEEYVPQLLLLPCNGVDDHGYRLGYGGGFFDRTLATLQPRPLAIGISFELGRVADIYPQVHDQALDYVVTEAGVWAYQR